MFDLLQYGNRLAVITDRGERITYAELHAMICTVKVPRGLVFCLCSNTLASLVGYLTCVQNHFPVVLLDSNKSQESLQPLYDAYQPEYVWRDSLQTTGMQGTELPQELALCLTTSGTTGSPKLVRLTEQNILSNARSIATYLNITQEERPVTSLPMYYSYGLSVINSHLLQGATLLLTAATCMQRQFWTFVTEQQATSLAGVPYTYDMLRRLHLERMELSCLKTFTQAGGHLSADKAGQWIAQCKKADRRFIVMYGQTEATARISYLPWECAEHKVGSIGVAIPGGRLSLVDEDGRAIDEPEVEGELIYEGPNVSMGYAECREHLCLSDENHGILHTGDLARRDADGFYYITGRLKRFVKVWGNRVNLDALEQMIQQTDYAPCACVGVDDKITLFATQSGIADSLVAYLVKQTGLNSRAFEVRKIDYIPRNSAGKVQYALLQQLLNA